MVQILEFEREIFALETQIQDFVSMSHMYDSVGDITHEIAKLKKKLRRMKHDVYSNDTNEQNRAAVLAKSSESACME